MQLQANYNVLESYNQIGLGNVLIILLTKICYLITYVIVRLASKSTTMIVLYLLTIFLSLVINKLGTK